MPKDIAFNLKPLSPAAGTADFAAFLDSYFSMAEQLAGSMDNWNKHHTYNKGTVQVVTLPSSKDYANVRKEFNISEFWCGRVSHHTPETIASGAEAPADGPMNGLVRTFSNISARLAHKSQDMRAPSPEPSYDRRATLDLSEAERQQRVMNTQPSTLYERFRRGLLEYHSETEREYIESCRETECLQVLEPHVAEIWRLTFVTPPPTSPRTFVVLVLSRELKCAPHGERAFMNVSIPFNHPDCKEKNGGEKSRVRGKYVSVELVREHEAGQCVEWRMATSSDAGGFIPRSVTNAALPSKVAEDVPAFLRWLVRKFPHGGEVQSTPLSERSQ